MRRLSSEANFKLSAATPENLADLLAWARVKMRTSAVRSSIQPQGAALELLPQAVAQLPFPVTAAPAEG